MKIKCPVAGCRYVGKGIGYINYHFDEKHGPMVISFNYAKLLSKIHEKIESLQNEIKGNHFEDCDSGHDFETHQNIEFAIEELKSLLEDKK